MTNELDRHETFDDGSSLSIVHTEQWTWRDGEGFTHDDTWPTKEEAEAQAQYIRDKVEAWENGDESGYDPADYPAPLAVVGRTITAASNTSCWRERT